MTRRVARRDAVNVPPLVFGVAFLGVRGRPSSRGATSSRTSCRRRPSASGRRVRRQLAPDPRGACGDRHATRSSASWSATAPRHRWSRSCSNRFRLLASCYRRCRRPSARSRSSCSSSIFNNMFAARPAGAATADGDADRVFFVVFVNVARGLAPGEPDARRADAVVRGEPERQVLRKVRVPERPAVPLHRDQDRGTDRGHRRRSCPSTSAARRTGSATGSRRRCRPPSTRSAGPTSPAPASSGCSSSLVANILECARRAVAPMREHGACTEHPSTTRPTQRSTPPGGETMKQPDDQDGHAAWSSALHRLCATAVGTAPRRATDSRSTDDQRRRSPATTAAATRPTTAGGCRGRRRPADCTERR